MLRYFKWFNFETAPLNGRSTWPAARGRSKQNHFNLCSTSVALLLLLLLLLSFFLPLSPSWLSSFQHSAATERAYKAPLRCICLVGREPKLIKILFTGVNQYDRCNTNGDATVQCAEKLVICKCVALMPLLFVFIIEHVNLIMRQFASENRREKKKQTMKLVRNICQQITWINIKNEWCIKWMRVFICRLLSHGTRYRARLLATHTHGFAASMHKICMILIGVCTRDHSSIAVHLISLFI